MGLEEEEEEEEDDDEGSSFAQERPPQPALEVEQAAMCRYGVDAEFYAATVAADNGDGTYGVRFDDGDAEPAVARRALYVAGQRQAEALDVGERVDAACDARDGDVLPATIAAAVAPGLYRVAFDAGVAATLPRARIFAAFHDRVGDGA